MQTENQTGIDGEGELNKIEEDRTRKRKKEAKETVPDRRYRQEKGLRQMTTGREPKGGWLQSPRDGEDWVGGSRNQALLEEPGCRTNYRIITWELFLGVAKFMCPNF